MTIRGSFGEQSISAEDLLPYINKVALPLWRKMLAAQNDCECEGGGDDGITVHFGLDEPDDAEEGDLWVEVA